MRLAGELAARLGVCTKECSDEITAALTKLGFSLACPISAQEMYGVILNDKKRNCTRIDLILPYEIGDCRIYPMTLDELKEALAI